MKEKVLEKLEELKEKVKKIIYVNPGISYNLNSKRTLGYYDFNTSTIHLNENLLNEFGDLYINEVLVHEFAHCVAMAKYGPTVKAHGKEWKQIARFLGLNNPRARTNLFNNSKHLQTEKYTYECKCSTYQLSKIRHNKIQKGTVYICKKCNIELKYKGKK